MSSIALSRSIKALVSLALGISDSISEVKLGTDNCIVKLPRVAYSRFIKALINLVLKYQ